MFDLSLSLTSVLRSVPDEGAAAPPAAPTNTAIPAINEASLTVGDSPTWTNGTWTGSPTSYTANLYADGVLIAGGPYASGGYALQAAEAGAEITVGVVATNAIGDSAEAFSDPVGPVGAAATLDSSLPTPTLERTTGATTYPPQLRVIPGVLSQEGDSIELWTDDEYTFASPRTDENTVVIDATIHAAGSANFNLAAVTSPMIRFFQCRLWRGTSYGPWSNIVNVGDTVAPTMTSATSFNATENASQNFALAADEGATFAVVGGTFATYATIAGSTLTLSARNREVDGASGTIIIRPTDYAGNVGADQTITATILDVDEQPDPLGFTDSTNVTPGSADITSQITISGLAAGVTVAGTFSSIGGGSYSINGGAFVTTANFTVTNGDTINSKVPPSASGTSVTSNTFSIGEPAVSDTHSVTTAASLPTIGGTWSSIVWPAQVTMYQGVTASGSQATAASDPVGYIEDYSAANFDWKAAAATGVRPLLGISGSRKWLTFDGVDDYLRAATDIALGAYAAGSCSMIFVGKFNPANIASLFAEGNSAENNSVYQLREYGSSTTGEIEAFVRNSAATQFAFSSNNDITAGTPKPLDNTERVIVIVDTGSSFIGYVDRVKMVVRTYTRSGTLTLNRVSLMAQLRGAVASFMAGDLEFCGIANGYQVTDGGVAVGASANGEVGSLSAFGGALQGRSI